MNLRAVMLLLCCLSVEAAHALYDPKPVEEIALVQGDWQGQLTYDDYSAPGKLVTLPTRAFAALAGPNELVVHYVFDDGPNKTVYAYESMRFDFERHEVRWVSGVTKREESLSKIVSNEKSGATWRLVFEHPSDKGVDRYSMDLGAAAWSLKKDEISADGTAHFRDRYEFQRKAK